MRDHNKRFTLTEWREYVQRTKDLAAECDVNDSLELPAEDIRWSKDDITQVKNVLVQTCPENLSESQGGEGPGDAPFNDEFFERLNEGRWSQGIIDSIDAAIERGCCGDCCWHITVEMDVDFTGNTQPNPQTPSLTTPASCNATSEELGALFEAAFNAWVAENQDSFPEGGVTFTPINAFLSSFPEEECEVSFSPPVVES